MGRLWHGDAVRVVVGAAVRDDRGRVLAARRHAPPGWEFPGGKVEAGETEAEALVRELDEELGIAVAIGERVGPDVPMPGGMVLRVWAARLTGGSPQPREHAELRWVEPAGLVDLDWLPADRPVVAALAARRSGGAP
jgi:8-oxo-dGTP diphosphatase